MAGRMQNRDVALGIECGIKLSWTSDKHGPYRGLGFSSQLRTELWWSELFWRAP